MSVKVKETQSRSRSRKKLPATKPDRKVRVLLVDDHPLVRSGIREFIERESDIEVCGEADTISRALESVMREKPDVALVDITLGKEDGISLIRDIGFLFPQTAVVVFTMHKEASYAHQAIEAGAKAVVLKQEVPDKLVQTIRSAGVTR